MPRELSCLKRLENRRGIRGRPIVIDSDDESDDDIQHFYVPQQPAVAHRAVASQRVVYPHLRRLHLAYDDKPQALTYQGPKMNKNRPAHETSYEGTNEPATLERERGTTDRGSLSKCCYLLVVLFFGICVLLQSSAFTGSLLSLQDGTQQAGVGTAIVARI